MLQIYKCIDDGLYYQSGMMPKVEQGETDVTTEIAKLTEEEKDEFAEICGAVQRCDDPDLDRGGSDLFCDRLYRRKAGGVF